MPSKLFSTIISFTMLSMSVKQQVLVIHGGTTFDTHEDYLQFLKGDKLEIEKLKPRQDWKNSLQDRLGEDFDVFQPRMPNGTNAQYSEWSIWFEKITKLLDDDSIFVGHSLGGVFLAKYLSENKLPKSIKALFLVAAPFNDEDIDESLASFRISNSLELCEQQVQNIYLYHSKDDEVVPFHHVNLYNEALPEATIVTFEDRGHFKQPEFPEIVEDIKKCV